LYLSARGNLAVVEMVQIEGEVVIEATPAEVFDFVADERNLYDPHIRRAERSRRGRSARGLDSGPRAGAPVEAS
jgi:hypothetical protein